LVYLLVWSPPPHIPYISSPNQGFVFTAHAHTITTCFAVVSILYHLFLVFLSTPYLELFYHSVTHPSDHSHLCPLKGHLVFFPDRPGLTSETTWKMNIKTIVILEPLTSTSEPVKTHMHSHFTHLLSLKDCRGYVFAARDVRLSLLLRNRWLMKEKYAELSCISCESLTQFAKDFFNGAFVEGLIQGNITAKVHCSIQPRSYRVPA